LWHSDTKTNMCLNNDVQLHDLRDQGTFFFVWHRDQIKETVIKINLTVRFPGFLRFHSQERYIFVAILIIISMLNRSLVY